MYKRKEIDFTKTETEIWEEVESIVAAQEKKTEEQRVMKDYIKERIWCVGNWIVLDGETYEITDIRENLILLSPGGEWGEVTVFTQEIKEDETLGGRVHKWSICDAKDGDVLYAEDIRAWYVFRTRDDKYDEIFKSHFSLLFNKEVRMNCLGNLFLNDVRPVTRQERKEFFKYLHKLGYIWD